MYTIFIIYCLGLMSILGLLLWKSIEDNEKLRKQHER